MTLHRVFLTLAKKPTFHQLLWLRGREEKTVKVVEEVAAKWELLAYALHFSPAIVETIRRDKLHECVPACQEILHRWLNGETRQPVSWQTLINSLRDCDFNTLADDLLATL